MSLVKIKPAEFSTVRTVDDVVNAVTELLKGKLMRQLLTGLSAIVLFAPFAVYFGIDKFGLNLVGAC